MLSSIWLRALLRWLTGNFRTRKRPPSRRVRRLRLGVEALEDRLTPSVTVTTTLDPATPIVGQLSLREALAEVNAGQVADNTIILPGGTYQNTQGALNVTHSLILQGAGAGNTILDGGGMDRVVLIDPAAMANVQLSGVTVRNGNTTGNGGGIDVVTNVNVTLQNSIFSGNSATLTGGGLSDNGDGNLTISNCTLSGNQASGGNGGGGINYTGAGSVQIANSIFSGNISHALPPGGAGGGGGLEVANAAATVTIVDSLFSGNNSTLGSGGGLDVSNGLTLTVIGSTFTGNQTSNGFGGGLSLRTSGTNAAGTASSLVDDTITANSSAVAGGGGVADFASGDLNFTSDTITGNSGGFGSGGVTLAGGAAFFLDTLDASNIIQAFGGNGSDIGLGNGAHFTSKGGNFIGNGSDITGAVLFAAGTPNANGDFAGTAANPLNPLLGPLQNNGGPLAGATGSQQVIPTEALLQGSLALGNGVVTGVPATDQRGFSRLANGHTDIGAFQFQDVPLLVIVTPAVPTVLANGTETFTVIVANPRGNALPADNATLAVTLSAGLAPTTPLTFKLTTLPAGQNQIFTVTANATTLGMQVITATVTSVDVNPNTITISALISVIAQPPTPTPTPTHTPVGTLTPFAFGFGPTGIDLFEIDRVGDVFAQAFMGGGAPLFLNTALHLPLAVLQNGQLLALLAGSNGQNFLIDVFNPFLPLVEPTVIAALMHR
ncbi:MAG TPA: choice-of-anchor Q domain-containing protein [Gemmataceae bacterium]|nr:choice-of-anchor Q domain-containing protein [Gemmataceae bacterium]